MIETVKENEREYSQGEPRPLKSYAGTLAVYGVAVGAATVIARLTGRRAPRLGARDVALMAVTTHKVSRTLAKDTVTSPLRAPFTRYKGTSGPAELAEEVRGKGVKHAIGELITCPFCMAQWVATAYTVGMTFAPDATRLAGATMTAVAGADWLQLAYARLQRAAEG
ncbi:DUF1360 domain-containing protein [Actinoallomurus sp. NPDC052308]|uniref:DUF1360 domain-containing protein n=1 Tax=Actinoallomurus sp. NPDC052308 TaxID=3155530 RepID=UPI0034134A70